MTEPRDYVELGTARVPDGTKKPNTLAYLSVYLQELTNTETAALQVIDTLLGWNVLPPRFSFVLDRIGAILGQPRPNGFDDVEYRDVLIARSIVRVSKSQTADLVKLVAYLSTLNGGLGNYSVSGGPPEHWQIVIFDVSLTAQWQAVYAKLIIDAIGVTDSFELTIGTSATALYDDDDTVYDVSLYS